MEQKLNPGDNFPHINLDIVGGESLQIPQDLGGQFNIVLFKSNLKLLILDDPIVWGNKKYWVINSEIWISFKIKKLIRKIKQIKIPLNKEKKVE